MGLDHLHDSGLPAVLDRRHDCLRMAVLMAWDYYQSGETVGAIKVVKLMTAALSMGQTEYLAEWTCCGGQEVMSHLKIRKKMLRGSVMCATCRGSLGFLSKVAYAEAKVIPQPRAVVYANGHYWPPLGPLGHR